jgi:hypothetical protein
MLRFASRVLVDAAIIFASFVLRMLSFPFEIYSRCSSCGQPVLRSRRLGLDLAVLVSRSCGCLGLDLAVFVLAASLGHTT